MAEALSNLRTRLARRLSHGTLSSALTNVYTEAINAAASRLALMSEDLPINHLAITAETWGNLSTTVSAAAQGATSFTFSGETFLSKNVFQGDILHIGNKRWLITTVTNTILGVGAPLGEAVGAGAATVYRRTIKLPYAGIVSGLTVLGSNDGVDLRGEPFQRSVLMRPVNTGAPIAYSAAYDKSNDAAYVSLFPAPTSVTRVVIKLTEVPTALSDDADSLDWPEKQIDALLELAREEVIRYSMNLSEVVLADTGKGRLQALHNFKEAGSTERTRITR